MRTFRWHLFSVKAQCPASMDLRDSNPTRRSTAYTFTTDLNIWLVGMVNKAKILHQKGSFVWLTMKSKHNAQLILCSLIGIYKIRPFWKYLFKVLLCYSSIALMPTPGITLGQLEAVSVMDKRNVSSPSTGWWCRCISSISVFCVHRT